MVNINIIEAKFKRSSVLPKYTSLWKDLSEIHKKKFEWIKLNKNEVIIIIYEEEKNNYFLTNQRILIKNGSTFYSEIVRINIQGLEKDKTEINKFLLELKSGVKMVLQVEKKTWFFLHGILKLLVQQSQIGFSK